MEISEDMYPSEQEGNPKAKAASESCQTGTETLLSLVVSKCTYTRRVSEEIEEKNGALSVIIVRSTEIREVPRLR